MTSHPYFTALAAIIFSCAGFASGAEPRAWQHEELRRFPAAEAKQGVAVDAEFFYAIDNHAIGKYRKDTGTRVAGWDGGPAGRIKHLNAGVVLDGKLYCAHSNFPALPEQSSVEIWDTATMQPVGEHPFAKPPGSLTWVDRRDGAWFACFAHYKKTSDPARTRVVKFDAEWMPLATWSFPAALIARFAGNSSSGGAFGPGGRLFVTGHDARELYVLDLPANGSVLSWSTTVPISAAGQAFAWDPSAAGVLYSIERKTREVIVSRIRAVKILFDTDMETDCDDAGALAVLHSLADRGECEILATVVSVKDPNSAATVDAINICRGRPGLPIGMVKGSGVLEKSSYVSRIAAEFPHRFKAGGEVPDATLIYRDVLEKQPDHSVVIVTVGYVTNLRTLMQLPAADGHRSGIDLIEAKVAKWVCMGGNFIGDPPRDDLKLGNVNFQRDAESALQVIPQWPTPLVFVGREIGSVPSGLSLGECLARTPPGNPVRRAYEHYFGGKLKNRHVADLVTVLYAVRGLRDYWEIESRGGMELRTDMTFDWKWEPDREQSFLLKKKTGGPPNDRYIERVLEELLVQTPQAPAQTSPP